MTTALGASPPARFGRVSLARNVLMNWTGMVLTVAATFFVTPVVVRTLHQESYGVWSFLNSLLIYSDLLYLGLGPALVKAVATNNAKGRIAELNRTASAVLSIYLVIGLLCAAVFAGLSPFVPQLFAQPLSSSQAETAASYACALLGIQLFASFTGSAFSGVLHGLERSDLIGSVRTFILIVRTLAIFALIGGPNALVVLAMITATGAMIELAGLAVMAFLVEPRLAMRLVVPTKPELKVLYGFGLQSFFVIFALTLISYTDTTVIGMVIGAAGVALYTLPLQLVEYIRVAAATVGGVWYPRLSVMANRQDVEGLRAAYVNMTRVTMFIASYTSANMILLGVPFLRLWVGPEFSEEAQWIIVCLAFATLIHIFAITTPVGFFQAMETLRFPAIALFVEALVNLFLSLYLAPRLGLLGVALGTLIPAVIMGTVVLPPYLWRKIHIRWPPVIGGLAPAVAVMGITAGTLGALRHVMPTSSYLWLIAHSLLTVPGLAMVFFGMFPREDRDWLVGQIRRFPALRPKSPPIG